MNNLTRRVHLLLSALRLSSLRVGGRCHKISCLRRTSTHRFKSRDNGISDFRATQSFRAAARAPLRVARWRGDFSSFYIAFDASGQHPHSDRRNVITLPRLLGNVLSRAVVGFPGAAVAMSPLHKRVIGLLVKHKKFCADHQEQDWRGRRFTELLLWL